MKKILFITAILISVAFVTNAQEYNTGIGIRGGPSNGLTVKHFISDDTALEGLFATRWGGFNLTGLYEIHALAFDTPRLYWYYGFGAHVGFWDGKKNDYWFEESGHYTVLGIDGILGIEYNIENIPFNISLDWKPGLNIIGYTGFWGDEAAISVRFVF